MLQKICRYCRKSAECWRKSSVIAENLQSVAGNLQVLQKICRYCRKTAECCRKSAGIAENLQSVGENLRLLQKICRVLQEICRYCRKSAGIAENLQSVAENLQVLQKICTRPKGWLSTSCVPLPSPPLQPTKKWAAITHAAKVSRQRAPAHNQGQNQRVGKVSQVRKSASTKRKNNKKH